MASLLTRIGLPRAIGLYVTEDAIYASEIVGAPFGPVEVRQDREPATAETQAAAVSRILDRLAGGRRLMATSLAIGLPVSRTYFTTRPIQSPGRDVSPLVLLAEALRSTNVPVEAMLADVAKAKPDSRPVASIAACEKEYLAPLLASLPATVRLIRVEPIASSLSRQADRQRRRRAKVTMRCFLSDREGLAVLIADRVPIVWRSFEMPRGDEASAVVSVGRALMTISKHCGIETELGGVLLHGRLDLARLVDRAWIEGQLQAGIDWLDDPALEPSAIALSVAVGCFDDQDTFDLARTLKPPLTFRQLFPLSECVLHGLMWLALALILSARWLNLSEQSAAMGVWNSQHAASDHSLAELKAEKAELEQKVAAVEKFLANRVVWTEFERELGAALPENVFLTAFHGTSELGITGGKSKHAAKPKKSLILRAGVSIPQSGLVPHEIDRLLNSLRENPLLKSQFPVIELDGLKQSKATRDQNATATFTVLCLPKSPTKTKTP